jgi:transaldolase
LSFDTAATLARARRIMALYAAQGVDTQRVLIKIAATWEGIAAAAQLEREGIHTNLTLLFAQCQAIACGDAGVKLISPFVGRIYDWHKKAAGGAWIEAERSGANDPGVQSVTQIFKYYKRHDIATEIMGASFRNIGQITALAGCDLLTIAPDLLAQLATIDAPLPKALDAASMGAQSSASRIVYNESAFRYALNQDACATEKLAEGIRAFAVDTEKCEALMQQV